MYHHTQVLDTCFKDFSLACLLFSHEEGLSSVPTSVEMCPVMGGGQTCSLWFPFSDLGHTRDPELIWHSEGSKEA